MYDYNLRQKMVKALRSRATVYEKYGLLLEKSKISKLYIFQEDIEECLPLKNKLKNIQGFRKTLRRRQMPSGLTKEGKVKSIKNEGDVDEEEETGEEGWNQLIQT